MKKFLWIITPIVLLVVVCTVCHAAPLGNKETEQIVTKEIPVPDFDAVNASRTVKVILTAQGDKIRITADEELQDQVIVKAEENDLTITIDPQIKSIGKGEITVTVPVAGRTLRKLTASSAARISAPELTLETSNLLVKASSAAKIDVCVKAESCTADASSAAHIGLEAAAPKCQFEASSAARIEARIDAQSCTARVTSTAGITLTGQSAYFEGESTSAGKINAQELVSTRASAKATSGSGITVNCSGELEARASSGASIRYKGDCRTTVTTSSGGSFRKL